MVSMFPLRSAWFTQTVRFVDLIGNGDEWHAHCTEHYGRLFAPFSERPNVEVEAEPTGLVFYPDIDNCVEYQHGSSIGSLFPEYHGHVENGIAFFPMFCPWCVHNSEIPLQGRMTQ